MSDTNGARLLRAWQEEDIGVFLDFKRLKRVYDLSCSWKSPYVFYSYAENVKLCKVYKLKEVDLPREHVFFGRGSSQHVGIVGKGIHRLWYHLYDIPEDVNLRNSASFAYGHLDA